MYDIWDYGFAVDHSLSGSEDEEEDFSSSDFDFR